MLGTKGTKMPRGDKQQIIQYVVYLPSKLEQNKIATFLSLLDSRIEAQIKIIEDLKLLKKTMSQNIFSLKILINEIKFSKITNNIQILGDDSKTFLFLNNVLYFYKPFSTLFT